jgi:hypothetical protein
LPAVVAASPCGTRVAAPEEKQVHARAKTIRLNNPAIRKVRRIGSSFIEIRPRRFFATQQ